MSILYASPPDRPRPGSRTYHGYVMTTYDAIVRGQRGIWVSVVSHCVVPQGNAHINPDKKNWALIQTNYVYRENRDWFLYIEEPIIAFTSLAYRQAHEYPLSKEEWQSYVVYPATCFVEE
jgi:hypothetical protein